MEESGDFKFLQGLERASMSQTVRLTPTTTGTNKLSMIVKAAATSNHQNTPTFSDSKHFEAGAAVAAASGLAPSGTATSTLNTLQGRRIDGKILSPPQLLGSTLAT